MGGVGRARSWGEEKSEVRGQKTEGKRAEGSGVGGRGLGVGEGKRNGGGDSVDIECGLVRIGELRPKGFGRIKLGRKIRLGFIIGANTTL